MNRKASVHVYDAQSSVFVMNGCTGRTAIISVPVIRVVFLYNSGASLMSDAFFFVFVYIYACYDCMGEHSLFEYVQVVNYPILERN